MYRRLSPETETRPALFEQIRASRSPFHRRRIHRRRLASMVILQPGLVARGMLRLPCAAGPKNRPTDLCKPIFSKKRTRSRSSISAVVAFAASALMACAVHAAPTAEAVYGLQLVGDVSVPLAAPQRDLRRSRHRPTVANLAFALPSTAARPRPLSRGAREGHPRCDDPERLPTMDALLGPSAISRLRRRDPPLAALSPATVSPATG